MMITLVLLCLGFLAWAKEPSLKMAIKDDQFEQIKEMLVKHMNKKSKPMHLEDFEVEYWLAKIIGKNNNMMLSKMDSNLIHVDVHENGQQFEFRAKNVSMAGSSNITVDYHVGKAECLAKVDIRNLAFNVSMKLIVVNDRPKVIVEATKISVTKEDVHIEIVGKVMEKFINYIISVVQNFFFENIKSQLESALPEQIANISNTIIEGIPSDMEVLPSLSLRFSFPTNFSIKNHYFIAPVLIYAHKTGDRNPPPYDPVALPDANPKCTRGVQFFFSDFVVRTLMETGQKIGLFQYGEKKKISGIKIEYQCHSLAVPDFQFIDGSISIKLNLTCKAKFDIGIAHATMEFLAVIEGKLKEWISKSLIYFEILKGQITYLHVIKGKILSDKQIKKLLNELLEELIKTVNKGILKEGIPLPNSKLFEFDNVEQTIMQHYVALCGTLKPKFSRLLPQ